MASSPQQPGASATGEGPGPSQTPLRDAGLLDGSVESAFGPWARLARRVVAADGALVALRDGGRLVGAGSDGPDIHTPTGGLLPGADAACRRVLAASDTVAVVDPAPCHAAPGHDPTLPAIEGAAFVGVPLRAPDRSIVGVLCVFSTRPRAWGPDEVATLEELAELTSGEVATRLAAHRVRAFAAEVDHGLRTPVAALDLQLRVLAGREDLGPEARADVAAATATVQDLTAALRTAGGAMERLEFGHERVVSVPLLLDEVATAWSADPDTRPEVLVAPGPAIGAGARVPLDDLGLLTAVRTDEVALRHALDRLVTVALEHGEGPVRLGVERSATWVRIRVEADGPSLAPAVAAAALARHDNREARHDELSWAAVVARRLGGRLVVPPADHLLLELVLHGVATPAPDQPSPTLG